MLKTPTRYQSEKKLHTPPSAGHGTPKQKPAKLLKSLSGKVFRKTPDMKSQDATFQSLGSFKPNEPMTMGKRHGVPKPLVLGPPLSPPPSTKKYNYNYDSINSSELSNPKLDSPVHLVNLPLHSPINIQGKSNRRNLTNTLLIETLSQIPEFPKNDNEDIVIWNDENFESKSYVEENSPLFNKGGERAYYHSEFKKYIGEKCVICEENVSHSFEGEKIIELKCNHTSHYKCYFMVMETLFGEEQIPVCKVCNKESGPKEESILVSIQSKLLSSTNTESNEVESQWIALNSSKNPTSGTMSFLTPLEQMIRTADIESDGFNMPMLASKTPINSFVDSVVSDAPTEDEGYREIMSLIQEDNNSTETLEDLGLNKGPLVETSECEIDHHYAIKVQVTMPDDNLKSNSNNDEIDIDSKLIDETRSEISRYAVGKLKLDDDLGNLLMFDIVTYSLEGERWFANTIIYYFKKYLILFDFVQDKISGKIPIEQISSIINLSPNKILVDLKSTSLPEIYLEFAKSSKNDLAGKWRYFMNHISEEPHFSNISDTALDLLPRELEEASKNIIKIHSSELYMPWVYNMSDLPIRLIVCINLSSFSHLRGQNSSTEYKTLIKESINSIISKLSDNDSFGLVLVGKNGNGEIGEYGTYVGTISKTWDGWDEIIHAIEPLESDIFTTPESELLTMLTTCYRLVSTVDDHKNTPEYVNNVIMIRERIDSEKKEIYPLIEKFWNRIELDNGFEISQVRLDDKETLMNKVDYYHRRNIYNLIVRLGAQEIKYNNMKPGESKSEILKQSSGSCKHRVCDISWYDMREAKRITKTALVIIK